MTVTEYEQLSTIDKVKILRACNGVHSSLDELFTCESCSLTLDLMGEN